MADDFKARCLYAVAALWLSSASTGLAQGGSIPKGESLQVVDTVYAGAIVRHPAFRAGRGPIGNVDPETGDYPIVFRRSDGTLLSHPLTDGRNGAERIDSIETFTGTAFHLSGGMHGGILSLPAHARLMMPVRSWQFTDTTAQMRADGLLQGAAFDFGRAVSRTRLRRTPEDRSPVATAFPPAAIRYGSSTVRLGRRGSGSA